MNTITKYFLIPIFTVGFLMAAPMTSAKEPNPTSKMATQLKDESIVVGVISGRRDVVAILFTEEPTTELTGKVCTVAHSNGFSTVYKIISGSDGSSLVDICD